MGTAKASGADGTTESSESGDGKALTVYYDGGCPLCRREIAAYRRAQGGDRLGWVDVSSCETASLGEGLTAERAMARLHVRERDGRLVDGAAAFAALWAALPRTRLLGRLAGSRVALAVLEPAYRLFLRVRRLWRRGRSTERARA